MKMGRHKWNGKSNGTGGKDGLTVSCIKCGCVKQWVSGFPTYFINDTVYDKKAPPCISHKLLTSQI